MPPIDQEQARLARPYPGGLFEKAVAARTRTLDPETAASYLTALGTHGQPGISVQNILELASNAVILSWLHEHLSLLHAIPQTDQTNDHWNYVIAHFAASVQLLFRHATPLQPSPHGALVPEPKIYPGLEAPRVLCEFLS